ncbi:MAG: hypothetical protein PHS79_03785 [Patescibacteria group bacterium]|nr:hypothetical protein [Patescibacteria group bacterium]
MNKNPKMNPVAALAYYIFVLALVSLVLYAFDLWWILGIPVIGLSLWGIYKIGERYGWWREGFK